MNRHTTVLGLFACALLSLGADDCDPQEQPCSLGDSGAFESIDERECGLGPDGVSYCHWQLTLMADSTFQWRWSDIGESGTWSCVGSDVEGIGSDGRLLVGTHDPATDLLIWDGVDYQRAP